MSEKDGFGYYVKGAVTSNAIDYLVAPAQMKRELGIQADKLRRMAEQFDKKFPVDLSTPPAKLRKLKAPHLYRLAQQSKRVDALLLKMIEGHARTLFPDAPLKVRRQIPAKAREVAKIFNGKIHEGTRLLESGVTGKALLEGISKLKIIEKRTGT